MEERCVSSYLPHTAALGGGTEGVGGVGQVRTLAFEEIPGAWGRWVGGWVG